MIYTIGSPTVYEPLLDASDDVTPYKKGRSNGYEGGWVFKAVETARMMAVIFQYHVYRVGADWDVDVEPFSLDPDCGHLLTDSPLYRLEGQCS